MPGWRKEYEKRHSPIWPELECSAEGTRCANYSIFLHPETRQLFGYAEIENEERWSAIADTAVCKKWWAHMKDLMPSNPDNSPVSRELKEVFHIDSSRDGTLNDMSIT